VICPRSRKRHPSKRPAGSARGVYDHNKEVQSCLYTSVFEAPLPTSAFRPKAGLPTIRRNRVMERSAAARGAPINDTNHCLPYPYHPASTPSAATRIPCACSARTGRPPQPCQSAYDAVSGRAPRCGGCDRHRVAGGCASGGVPSVNPMFGEQCLDLGQQLFTSKRLGDQLVAILVVEHGGRRVATHE
jgi:hypothetical protein